jgi:hypothetical protein
MGCHRDDRHYCAAGHHTSPKILEPSADSDTTYTGEVEAFHHDAWAFLPKTLAAHLLEEADDHEDYPGREWGLRVWEAPAPAAPLPPYPEHHPQTPHWANVGS